MAEPTNVNGGNNGSAAPLTMEQNITNANAVILANAGELAAGIISEIAGNDISTSINGSKATVEIIQNLLYQRMHQRIQKRIAAKR